MNRGETWERKGSAEDPPLLFHSQSHVRNLAVGTGHRPSLPSSAKDLVSACRSRAHCLDKESYGLGMSASHKGVYGMTCTNGGKKAELLLLCYDLIGEIGSLYM